MKLEQYKAKVLWPMTILAAVFLVFFLLEAFRLPIALENPRLFDVINLTLWAIFALDYLLMLYLAENKKIFVKNHVLDLILVILPFLRPLRALRLVVIFQRAFSGVKQKLYVNIPIYVGFVATFLVILGGAAIFSVEVDNPDANIKTPGDALWWSVVTVTTVGYGDKYPVSIEGRWIAILLMITGIAVVGTVTASLAAWIVEKVDQETKKSLGN